jgi:hypothetical protein
MFHVMPEESADYLLHSDLTYVMKMVELWRSAVC